MKKLLLAATLLAATPVFAEGLATGLELGTSEEAVSAALTEMGYEVRKMDLEDGLIEAYAVKGTEMAEIYVDPQSGLIVRIGGDE